MSAPLAPGSTIGILGGGQLGRMLSQAASRLGFDVVILDPEDNSPAGRVSRGQIVAAYDDATALNVMGRVCDVVTFEFENVPAVSVERLAEGGALVAPGPTALLEQAPDLPRLPVARFVSAQDGGREHRLPAEGARR